MGNNKTDGETRRVSCSGSGAGLKDSRSRLRQDEAKPRVICLVVRLEKQPSSTYLGRMKWTFAYCLQQVRPHDENPRSSRGQSHDPREICHSMPAPLRTRVPHSPRRTTVALVFSRRRLACTVGQASGPQAAPDQPSASAVPGARCRVDTRFEPQRRGRSMTG
ncbi:hypothetical protein COCMIDRAFT_26588 [Bipolaris oryzae ATCC 44560]|uniref:Uncharacterized protein n=1 Tax=Bipolaris oryzae ATCC 44560 TaxID=930090 RepID=W6ZCP2_COCMI|nr:uncharacterized protein COCMIDRAFT_26588 [Bipolaris oryzae ATCC 44560]EUC45179.1 hypothetical protein COCMIDRAFT_26588 [Bipolaris oryzae ATCC 44560]